MQGTRGFVTWQDVASDFVEGTKATFYFMPSQPMQGWAGNSQRKEVKSFRGGRLCSPRDRNARIYIEFIPRSARKPQTCVERSRPSLVILAGWGHPDPPDCWIIDEKGSNAAKWPLFAQEWRSEMDAFLAEYLRDHPCVQLLADFRDFPNLNLPGRPSPTVDRELISPEPSADIPHTISDSGGQANAHNSAFPDERDCNEVFTEGALQAIVLNRYERNAAARSRCIEHYGSACFFCGFDFTRMYGRAARGYIHVHHLTALSEIGTEYVVDPIADLRPVCPNCHAFIHSRKAPYTVDELRAAIDAARSAK